MLRKNWFDDAVGLVEGFEIFRRFIQLMREWPGTYLHSLDSAGVLICWAQKS